MRGTGFQSCPTHSRLLDCGYSGSRTTAVAGRPCSARWPTRQGSWLAELIFPPSGGRPSSHLSTPRSDVCCFLNNGTRANGHRGGLHWSASLPAQQIPQLQHSGPYAAYKKMPASVAVTRDPSALHFSKQPQIEGIIVDDQRLESKLGIGSRQRLQLGTIEQMVRAMRCV